MQQQQIPDNQQPNLSRKAMSESDHEDGHNDDDDGVLMKIVAQRASEAVAARDAAHPQREPRIASVSSSSIDSTARRNSTNDTAHLSFLRHKKLNSSKKEMHVAATEGNDVIVGNAHFMVEDLAERSEVPEVEGVVTQRELAIVEEAMPIAMAKVDDNNNTNNEPNRYELISGLWVALSPDAEIDLKDIDGSLLVSVRSKYASLGDSFWRASGVRLEAKLIRNQMQDLILTVEDLVVDPLMTREKVVAFLEKFGLPQPKINTAPPAAQFPHNRRLSPEEWEEFIVNAQQDIRPGEAPLIKLDDMATPDKHGIFQKLDLKIPFAQVKAMACDLPSHQTKIQFPDCQGSANATLRTLLEYYIRAVLNQMDLRAGVKADVSVGAVVSDVASVKASMVGAVVGGAVLGPAGFVAGSYMGGRFIRHSTKGVAGATAGMALFGPVGLVAGAATCPEAVRPQVPNSITIDDTGNTSRRHVFQAASDHVAANKYEYAGSTGVVAGATLGAALLGPIGLVAGSVAGSLGSRKLVESTTSSANAAKNELEQADEKKPYRFGDYTRRMVARGKQARAADANEGYRFGDLTRGLFS